tara:strand:- start:23100 stop:23822 length:723 start_codon:yes stop_codon:yes gene_type:complete
MIQRITIDKRFQGPPFGANGGYCIGLALQALGQEYPMAAEVSLYKPIPMDVPLSLSRQDGMSRLHQDDTLLVEGKPYDLDAVLKDIPPGVTYEEALAAEKACVFPGYNPFRDCYVCGDRRDPRDAPHLMSGPVAGRKDGLLACVWRPSLYLADEGETVSTLQMAAVLDCPSAWAIFEPGEKALIGRQHLALLKEVTVAQDYIVTSWPIRRDGRKLFSGAAIFDHNGDLLGAAKSTWIRIE